MAENIKFLHLIEDRFSSERYSRQELISWWDQRVINNAKIMVVGAGALGNEIIKNLVLLGVGRLIIVDFDVIEESNLNRSVLFTQEEQGQLKVEVAKKNAIRLNSEVKILAICGNIMTDIGLGLYRRVDLVIAGLDNREARQAINQACYHFNIPWIDGATEGLNGSICVFVPPGPCYECTLSPREYKLMEIRRSCTGLMRSNYFENIAPATITSSSIIAALEVQEGIKILHKKYTLEPDFAKGLFFNGDLMNTYILKYPFKDDCPAHELFLPVVETDFKTEDTTIGDFLAFVRRDTDGKAILELNQDILKELICRKCGQKIKVFRPLKSITQNEGTCSRCQEEMETVNFYQIDGKEEFLGLTFKQIGVPALDILKVKFDDQERFYEFTGDLDKVFSFK